MVDNQQPDIMTQEEQLEWLSLMDPVDIKARLVTAIKEFPASDDVYALVMEVII